VAQVAVCFQINTKHGFNPLKTKRRLLYLKTQSVPRRREERRLRVFENRVLRIIFRPKTDEETGNRENYMMRSLMICTAHQMLCG